MTSTKVTFYVYEHIFPNGKRYIGITSQSPEERWDYGWGYKKAIQPLMYYAIQKYGWKQIKHNILFSGLSLDEAQGKEKELIAYYHTCTLDPMCNGYNMTYGGEGMLKYLTIEDKEAAKRKRYEEKKRDPVNREKKNSAQRRYYQNHKKEILLKDQLKREEKRKANPPRVKQTREEKLQKKREAEHKRLSNMTPEQKKELKAKARAYYLKNREKILQHNKEKYYARKEAKGE